jgi:acetyl-CoA carboxylase biotin carboxyl carrier protein
MRIKEVKELLKLLEKSDIAAIEIREGDYQIKIDRGRAAPPSALNLVPLPAAAAAPATAPAAQAAAPAAEAKAPAANLAQVKSPFVGTFYRAPSPGAKTYVEVGDTVKKGQILCIVEAMKLMNEIESEVDGVVRGILVENAKPVEFGEVLFEIELK